jgi:hypothetical protein
MQVSDVSPKGARFAHITAEYMGKRYYMGSRNGFVAAETRALELKAEFSKASFFVSDRDNLSISGIADDFYAAMESR